MPPLILFYLGSHPDNHGRYLQDILKQDDHWFESCHNYIQWIFPNKECSQVTPEAPVLTAEVIQLFKRDELLRAHLLESLHRILAFYGLQRLDNVIIKGNNWASQKRNWFLDDTHNSLRLYKILKCFYELDFREIAKELYAALVFLRSSEKDCGIGDTAFAFWAEAINLHQK